MEKEKDDLDRLENHVYIEDARARGGQTGGPGAYQQQQALAGPGFPGGFSPFQDPFQSFQMQPQAINDQSAREMKNYVWLNSELRQLT